MGKVKFLYARIHAWTATFKMPLFYSNTGVKSVMPTMRIPPYTTIVGMLGNIVGRDLRPEDVQRVGFMFDYGNKDNVDLEKLVSFELKDDVLKLNKGQSNPTRREFLVRPVLHLYLENINLFQPAFDEPFNIPSLGRSQDLAWLETFENGKQYQIVEAQEVPKGTIRNTLVPFPQVGASGVIFPLVDYYNNFEFGHTRSPGSIRTYQFIESVVTIERADLYKVSNLDKCVIYMHKMQQ